MKEELIKSNKRAKWGEASTNAPKTDGNDDDIEEELDEDQYEEEEDELEYTKTGEFDYYDDEYGEAVS